MDSNEFLRQQQAAVERMREMNARASSYKNVNHQMPPIPSFVNLPEKHKAAPPPNKKPLPEQAMPLPPANKRQPTTKTQQNGFGIPFLDSIIKDSDTTLIIGLLLILMSENSDKMLLFALIYILM